MSIPHVLRKHRLDSRESSFLNKTRVKPAIR